MLWKARRRSGRTGKGNGEDSCCVSIPSATPSILHTAEELTKVLHAAISGSDRE